MCGRCTRSHAPPAMVYGVLWTSTDGVRGIALAGSTREALLAFWRSLRAMPGIREGIGENEDSVFPAEGLTLDHVRATLTQVAARTGIGVHIE